MLSRFRRTPSADKTDQPVLADCMRAFEGEFEFVYRALRRFGLHAADAEDVAQDVFVVMLRRWSDFDPQRPLRPWLLGITHRVAMHHLRRSWRETPSGFIDLRDESPAAEEELSARGAQRLVSRALTELKDKQREVLVLHELEGMPMQDIAKASGEPLQTLYSRLKSAHRAFGRAVRRMGRFPTGAAALLPLPLLAYERDHPRPPAPPAVRRRILDRARTTSQPRNVPSFSRAPGTALVYLTGGALLVAGVLGLVSGARLLAADRTEAGGTVAVASPSLSPSLPGRSSVRRNVALARAVSLSVGTASSRSLESLGTNLVGYWRFDDAGAGKGARDFSGNGTDCVLRGREQPDGTQAPLEGPTPPEGALGTAMTFGGHSWLECPQPRFHRERSNELSVALWLRVGRLNKGWRTLVSRQRGEAHSDHFFVGIADRRLLVQSDAFGARVLGPPLTAGAWTHVAVTWRDGATTLYVDGLEVGHSTGPRATELDPNTPLLIGAGMNGPAGSPATQQFRGNLDELLVYDRALSREEVTALAGGVQPRLSF